jgi:two-component system, cell cycle sensor histidine kinase and response regulator CckA
MQLVDRFSCRGLAKTAARLGFSGWMSLAASGLQAATGAPVMAAGVLEDHTWILQLLVMILIVLGLAVFGLIANIRHRKRIEEHLRLDEARLEALVKLGRMQSAPLSEFTNYVLDQAVSLSKSKMGYLALTSEDEKTLNMFAWSASAMELCAMKEKPRIFPVEKTGLLGETIRQRKPILTNDYHAANPSKHGLPEGHVAVTRYLGVPVFDGSHIVAVVGVSNKTEPYDESDIRQLTLLMEGMWRMFQREQAAKSLLESEARLKQAQRIGGIGSWDLDMETESLVWSDETFRIFGRKPGEFVPTRASFMELVLPEDRDRVRNAMNAAMESGNGYSVDHRIVLPGGVQSWVREEAQVCLSLEEHPIKLLGTVQDITERRQLEERFRQAQKMEAVGQLAGGVAHDFNNILTIIQGHVGLALSNPDQMVDVRESLQEIRTAAERAARLTRQLLAFSRRQMLQVRYVDLNDIVDNLTKMLHRLLGETIQLKFQRAKVLSCIEADSGMIEQIIMNLVINARDAMTSGGSVTLSTYEKSFSNEDSWKNPDIRPGEFVCLEVADTGCGMDQVTMAHIFEPFFTTKELGRGTGLGLSTVYGIAKQHRGWVEVESTKGAGTVFRVFFPVCAKPGVVVTQGGAHVDDAAGSETILAVEDEIPVRQLARVCLQRKGYRVLEASNGREALDIWNKYHNEIDLLLTDQIMPEGMSGRELASHCISQKPGLKVLYSSGYSLNMIQGDLRLTEGVNFLPKPYDSVKLIHAVRACLDA